MVQPQYSPQEALERIKLMMEYDSSKTLTENEKIISEQYVAPAAVATAAGAGIGAAAGAALPTSVAIGAAGSGAVGTGVASGIVYSTAGALGVGLGTAGAIVGGAAALAVLPLVYWLVTKDTGANKVKKMFEMCSSESAKIAKLERKMQDAELRSIGDDIEDAIINDSFGFQGGTDEEKLFGAFKKLESGTASDFCALVAMYNKNSDSGDLFDDLDSDIDAESEWKQIFRPIRNCVEDSLLTIKDEEPKKTGGGTPTPNNPRYRNCDNVTTYTKGCKTEKIKPLQTCLGLVPDGKFWEKTQAALVAKGYKNGFTDADIPKICGDNNPTPGEETLNNPTPGEETIDDVNNG